MQNRTMGVGLLAICAVGSGAWMGCGKAQARGEEAAAAKNTRQSVELTVYSEDFGMVREARPAQLTQGANRLHLPDVSRLLDPQSVLLRWQGDEKNLPQLVAHTYDLGVGSNDALLKRYLGQEVEVVRYGDNGHEAERQKGTLMAQANGGIVLESEGKFYVQPPGTVVAPARSDVVTIPQLSVQAESPGAQAATLEVAYLTRGLSWSADYVARLSPQSDTLALECWATVTNGTGVDYPNAKVSLIAGTPNRAVRPAAPSSSPASFGGGRYRGEFEDGSAKRMQMKQIMGGAPESVGDFYSYAIKNPTTIAQAQMNRLLVLSSESVPVKKDYSARVPQLSAWDDSWFCRGGVGTPHRDNVTVALTLFNREKDGLGAPLPQGAIRVYEPDASNTLRYGGAATLQSTPKDQKIEFTLANAFDVFTEWRTVQKEQRGKHTLRKVVEVVLHNEKTTAVNLRVVQGFGGLWKIVRESHKHVNLDAYQTNWTVPVPAQGKTLLTFTVDLTI